MARPTRLRLRRGHATPRPTSAAGALPARGTPVVDNLQRLHARGLRAKLTVSTPGDADERQAERQADAFVAGAARTDMPVQMPRAADCSDCDAAGIDPRGGQPLAAGTRLPFEQFFGTDLSGVRVVDDAAAQRAAVALNARAFSYRGSLYFGAGEFEPGSARGRHLLAHELAHATQAGRNAELQREGPDGGVGGAEPDAGADPSSAASFDPSLDAPVCRAEGDVLPDGGVEPMSCDDPSLIPYEIGFAVPTLDRVSGELRPAEPQTITVDVPVLSSSPQTFYAVPSELVFATEEEALAPACDATRSDDDPLIAPPPVTTFGGIAWTAQGRINVVYVSSDFVVTTDFTNVAVGAASTNLVRTDQGLMLIDAGSEVGPGGTASRAAMEAAAIQAIVRDAAGQPIERVLITHAHADHLNLLARLAAEVDIRVIQLTARAAATPAFREALTGVRAAQATFRNTNLPAQITARLTAEREAWIRELPAADRIDPERSARLWQDHVNAEIAAAQARVAPVAVDLLIADATGARLVRADIVSDPAGGPLEARPPAGTSSGGTIDAPVRSGPVTTFTHPDAEASGVRFNPDLHSANYIVDLPNGEQIVVVSDLRDSDLLEVRTNFERAMRAAGRPVSFRVLLMGHHLQQGFVSLRRDAGVAHLVDRQFLVDAAAMLAELVVAPEAGGAPVRRAVAVGGAESRLSPAMVWFTRSLGFETFVTTDVNTVTLLSVLYGENERLPGITGTPRGGGRPSVALALRAGLSISTQARALAALDAQIAAGTADAAAAADRPAQAARLATTRSLLRAYFEAVENEIGRSASPRGLGAGRPAVAPPAGTEAGTAAAAALTAHLDAIGASVPGPTDGAPLSDPVLVLIDRDTSAPLTERQTQIRDGRLRIDALRAQLEGGTPPEGLRLPLLAEMEALQPLLEAEMAGLAGDERALFESEIARLTTGIESLQSVISMRTISGPDPASGGRTRTRIAVEQPIRPGWTPGRQRVERFFGVAGQVSGAVMIYHSFSAQGDLSARLERGDATALEGLAGTVHNVWGASAGIRMLAVREVAFDEFVLIALLDIAATYEARYASREAAEVALAYSALRNAVNLALFAMGGLMMRSSNSYMALAGFALTLMGEPLLRLTGAADAIERWFSFDPGEVTDVRQELRDVVNEYRTVLGALQLSRRSLEELGTLGARDAAATRTAAEQAISAHRQEARDLEPDIAEEFREGYEDAATGHSGLRSLDALRDLYVSMRSQVWEGTDRGAGSAAEAAGIDEFQSIDRDIDLSDASAEDIEDLDQWDELGDIVEDVEEGVSDAENDSEYDDWSDLFDDLRDAERMLENARYRLNPAGIGPHRATPLLAEGSSGRAAYEIVLARWEARVSALQARLTNAAAGTRQVTPGEVTDLVTAASRLQEMRAAFVADIATFTSGPNAHVFDPLWGSALNPHYMYENIIATSGIGPQMRRLEARELALQSACGQARSLAVLDRAASDDEVAALGTAVEAAEVAIQDRRNEHGIVFAADVDRLAGDVRSAEESSLEHLLAPDAPELSAEEDLALRSDEVEDTAAGISSVRSQLAHLRAVSGGAATSGLRLYRLRSAEGWSTSDWVVGDPNAIVGATGEVIEDHDLLRGGFTMRGVVPISAAAVAAFGTTDARNVDARNLAGVTIAELGAHPYGNAGAGDAPDEEAAERDAAAFDARFDARAVGSAIGGLGAGVAGAPLPDPLRGAYERHFGVDLGAVRLHVDDSAAAAAQALDARAFALGQGIYFDRGRFDPGSATGARLLAHELAHVVQARGQAPDIVRRQVNADAPAGAAAPPIELDPLQPWRAEVDADGSLAAVSRELYGLDLSALFETDDGRMSLAQPRGRVHLRLLPGLLRPAYAQRFHALMAQRLDTDVTQMAAVLRNTSLDAADEACLLDHLRWWAPADAMRDPLGASYFDRLLARLDGLSFGDDSGLMRLYGGVRQRGGELFGLIAVHSERYGGAVPAFAPPDAAPAPDRSGLLVKAVTDQILDRVIGATTVGDEQAIVERLVALPTRLQARVLYDFTRRIDEHDALGFSRTGEQDAVGMLFLLFENVTDERQKQLADDLVAKGVLSREQVRALMQGRPWAGRNLPWSTHLAQEATEYWAKESIHSDSALGGAANSTMGGLSSLWLPETALATITTLAVVAPKGVVASSLAAAPLRVQQGVLLLGTGAGAYQATRATIEAAGGVDAEGRQLAGAERVARALEAVSTAILLGVGFKVAPELAVRPPSGLTLRPPLEFQLDAPALLSPASGGPRVVWQVLSADGADELVVLGLCHETGEFAVVRINQVTGDGSVFSPTRGSAAIVGGRLQPPRLALPAGSAGGDAAVAPTTSAPRIGTPARPALPAGPAPRPALGPGTPMAALPAGAAQPLAGVDYEDLGDLGFGAGTPLTWSVSPDGTVFATPPLPDVPLYAPTGELPPYPWYSGRPAVPMLQGELRPGFTPFDVLPGPAATTKTLGQVRGTRGGNKARGSAGEQYQAEKSGGAREVEYDLPAGLTRRADVVARRLGGKLMQEVKNYLRYIGRGTPARVVEPSAFLRSEIMRDAMIMAYYPDHQAVWVFMDAPPSPELLAELREAGIAVQMYSDRLAGR